MTPGDDLGRFRYLELCNIHVVLAVGLELNFRKSPNPPLAYKGIRVQGNTRTQLFVITLTTRLVFTRTVVHYLVCSPRGLQPGSARHTCECVCKTSALSKRHMLDASFVHSQAAWGTRPFN